MSRWPEDVNVMPEGIARMGTIADRLRPAETIGPVRLSIQASSTHYCTPRVDGLLLSDYTAVEVAMWPEADGGPGRSWITKPSTLIETPEFDVLWYDDDVAGYVPLATALKLRAALRFAFGVTR